MVEGRMVEGREGVGEGREVAPGLATRALKGGLSKETYILKITCRVEQHTVTTFQRVIINTGSYNIHVLSVHTSNVTFNLR